MTLEQAIGVELKRLREAQGVRQEAVAAGAQSYGLTWWNQSTVASIELGRRALSIGELALLPLILRTAGVTSGPPLAPSDLVPATDEDVEVAPDCTLPLRVVRGLLQGGTADAGARGVPKRAPSSIVGEAERKAARKLGVTPAEVDRAARDLWKMSLTAWRDKTVGFGTRKMLELDPEGGARRLQAIRGATTRRLIGELEAALRKGKQPRRPRR